MLNNSVSNFELGGEPDNKDRASRLYKLAYHLTEVVDKLAGVDFTLSGNQSIPKDGPAILAYTHHNSWDVPALGHVVYEQTKRPLHFVAKKELGRSALGPFMKHIHGVFIDRQNPKISQIKQAIKVLEDGEMLAIAPEGGRIDGHRVRASEIKRGIGLIATRFNVDIIPVGIAGRNWRIGRSNLSFLPRSVHVHFGSPFRLRSEGGKNKVLFEQNKQKIAERLQSVLTIAYANYALLYGEEAAAQLDRNIDSKQSLIE
jgi:1-acyl-sn-glycerol-3-phosphate acyltransferase